MVENISEVHGEVRPLKVKGGRVGLVPGQLPSVSSSDREDHLEKSWPQSEPSQCPN